MRAVYRFVHEWIIEERWVEECAKIVDAPGFYIWLWVLFGFYQLGLFVLIVLERTVL
jgi:hypothetical protein